MNNFINESKISPGQPAYFGISSDPLPDQTQTVPNNFTFCSPVGITKDKYNNYWVTDTGNSRVIIFNKDFRKIIQSNISLKYTFDLPFRLADHPVKNRMYVSDMANHRIVILKYTYNPSTENYEILEAITFGKHGLANGQFNAPNGVAVTKDFKIIIADEFANQNSMGRIQIFDENGKFINCFNKLTGDDGKEYHFFWPQGLDVDSKGNLYFTDPLNYRILKCDLDGNAVNFTDTGLPFINCKPGIDSSGSSISITFKIPRGIKILKIPDSTSSMEKIFISDNEAGNIEIFNKDTGSYEKTIKVNWGPMDCVQNSQGSGIYITHAGRSGISQWIISSQTQEGEVIEHLRENGKFLSSTSIEKQKDGKFICSDFYIQSTQVEQKEIDIAYSRINKWEKSLTNWSYISKWALPEDIIHPWVPFGIVLVEKSSEKTKLDFPLLFISDFALGGLWVYEISDISTGKVTLIDHIMGMSKPKGIDVDHHTMTIYVADSENDCVQLYKYDINSKKIIAFGSVLKDQLCKPNDVAFYDNKIYIADYYHHRIVIFDLETEKIIKIIGYEVPDLKMFIPRYSIDGFCLPTAVHVEGNEIFIADLVNRSIKVYENGGSYNLKCFFPQKDLSTGYSQFISSKDGGMWFPSDIKIYSDDKKRIYMPDRTLNRVNIYDYDV